jgi:hypothetical protein
MVHKIAQRTKIAGKRSLPRGKLSEIREKKGESGAYKYEGTKAGKAYAGPHHSFPIGDIAHARNALARAHFSPNPEQIKRKVYAKYPKLKDRHEKREGEKET